MFLRNINENQHQKGFLKAFVTNPCYIIVEKSLIGMMADHHAVGIDTIFIEIKKMFLV